MTCLPPFTHEKDVHRRSRQTSGMDAAMARSARSATVSYRAVVSSTLKSFVGSFTVHTTPSSRSDALPSAYA